MIKKFCGSAHKKKTKTNPDLNLAGLLSKTISLCTSGSLPGLLEVLFWHLWYTWKSNPATLPPARGEWRWCLCGQNPFLAFSIGQSLNCLDKRSASGITTELCLPPESEFVSLTQMFRIQDAEHTARRQHWMQSRGAQDDDPEGEVSHI